MFEKWRIKEHMEVVDSMGRHVGTVDEVEDSRIKLTRSDAPDSAHHYLDLDAVERIAENRVYMKEGTPLPAGREAASVGAGTGSSGANLGGSRGAADLPGEDSALFGTSGHGTGMGGSGVR